jgi:3-hydroxy acid dehydrogenase / malonic semialdehyde reductase
MSKTVIITGASSGFGEATARKLHKAGHRLLLVARREDRLKKLADELGDNVFICKADVSKPEDVKNLFANLPEGFSDLDVLVNSAGLALGAGMVPDVILEDWDTMIDTNNKGLVHMSLEAIEVMKPNNKGQIVNIGSVAGITPYPGGNVYGATKAFVRQFTRNLRLDVHGFNIRVGNIEPGAAQTEFSEVRFKGDKVKAKSVYEGYRELTADDVSEAIVWTINLPEHVNIDNIEIMPTDQTAAGLQFAKS